MEDEDFEMPALKGQSVPKQEKAKRPILEEDEESKITFADDESYEMEEMNREKRYSKDEDVDDVDVAIEEEMSEEKSDEEYDSDTKAVEDEHITKKVLDEEKTEKRHSTHDEEPHKHHEEEKEHRDEEKRHEEAKNNKKEKKEVKAPENEPSKVAQIIGTAVLMVITLLIVWLLVWRYCGL